MPAHSQRRVDSPTALLRTGARFLHCPLSLIKPAFGAFFRLLMSGAARVQGSSAVPKDNEEGEKVAVVATGAPPERSSSLFVALLFLITIPVYVLRLVPPLTLVMVYNPLIAASILVHREGGWAEVKRLLGRTFDHRRITRRRWYIPILLLMPAVLALQYAWMVSTGVSASLPRGTVPLLPAYFLLFIIAGIGEEVGWSGYALDPLQDRYGALPAGILIGGAWALWHLVPYAFANPPIWVAGQCAATMLTRVLMVWIYNNTGRSVFGMILFHAMINMVTIPDYGFPYDPVVASAVLAVTGAVVVVLWGPRTLADFRYAR